MAGLPGDFIITYEFNRTVRRVQTPTESQYRHDELIHGFWIDANHNLCREDRGKFWIPAGRIHTIEKLG